VIVGRESGAAAIPQEGAGMALDADVVDHGVDPEIRLEHGVGSRIALADPFAAK
jgi:hypothetical protein